MSSAAPADSKQSPSVVTPPPLRWHGHVTAAGISLAVRAMDATWRIRFDDPTNLFEGDEPTPAIFCAWHNRLALTVSVYRRYFLARQPQRKIAALISASRDGAVLSRTLEHFGVQPVRGSSSRRGAQAMRELVSWARKGFDLAITPDGPRGPRYQVQEGTVKLAQITGHPMVPVSARIHWKKCFKSWDAFQFPLPFTRCDVRIGEPILVPRRAKRDECEEYRAELEARMKAITVD
jgi:lysophospholipid acyltransferase (LPLAT)-like uncharacterized protein